LLIEKFRILGFDEELKIGSDEEERRRSMRVGNEYL
jgi:hypothetical protein